MAYIRRNMPKVAASSNGKVIGILNKTCGVGDALALRALLPNIREKYPDHSIDLIFPDKVHPFIKDHPLVRRVVGTNLLKKEQFNTLFNLSDLTLKNPDRNPLDLWSEFMHISATPNNPEINLASVDIERASRYIRKLSSIYLPLILICPFSSIPQKSLSHEKVKELYSALEESGYCPLVVHSSMLNHLPTNQTGKLPLKTWAALFSLCDGIVTVSTSHLWMASFYNKPTVSLLGSEGSRKYQRYFPRLREYRPGCQSPCYNPLNCSRKNTCLDIRIPEVLSQIKSFGLSSGNRDGKIPTSVVTPTTAPLDLSRNTLVGVRIQGLLGDSIKAASVISALPADRKILVSLSYPELRRHDLVRNLFSNLLRSGRIINVIPSARLGSGPIEPGEIQDLRARGCREIYDITVLNQEFDSYPKDKPDLGIPAHSMVKGRVCLMRRSHFHEHFLLRNRPYEEWEKIESYLLKEGFQPEILGLDDPMPNPHGFPDYRKLLTPIQTLERVMGCQFVITIPTFIPVYSCQYKPTLVISDPRDIPYLRDRWYHRGDVSLFDVTQNYVPDLLETIKSRFLS